jgi:hypothetical protein
VWEIVPKCDPGCARLFDGHYSRRKRSRGSLHFMPPGQTLVLAAPGAVFGWWRPHPASGQSAYNGLDGWTCTVFRNIGPELSSALILAAEELLVSTIGDCGPSGLLTYVHRRKVKSPNPGYCFKVAGYRRIGRSKDGRKDLLSKPWELAGVASD